MLPGIASLCPDQCRNAAANAAGCRHPASAALPIHSGSSDATATGGNAPTLRIIEGPQRACHRIFGGGRTRARQKHRQLRLGSPWLAVRHRSIDSELRAVELEATLPAATIVRCRYRPAAI